MSYALLPENVTSSFVKELRELSQNHHKYEINRLLNKNANYGGLKKSKEEILAIKMEITFFLLLMIFIT